MMKNLTAGISLLIIDSFLLFFLPVLSGLAQKETTKEAESLISAAFMKEHIEVLASDRMMGRSMASGYMDTAAAYLARQFREIGLAPPDGSYFQNLTYCYTGLGKDNFLAIISDTGVVNYHAGTDFLPVEISGARPAEADVVFAGYGITAPEFGYDDYQGINVKGKIVLVLRYEPGLTDSTQSKFLGNKVLTDHSGLREKQKNAADRGAIGLLVVTGPMNSSTAMNSFRWTYPGDTTQKELLPIKPCQDAVNPIPVLYIAPGIAGKLIGSVDSLAKLQQRIEQTFLPHSYLLSGKSVAMNVAFSREPIPARNVVGFLEGSDPAIRDEVVIIGGHYDHVGFTTGEKAVDGDSVYNGADDNASGTAGVLAIARAFTSLPEKPGRSVLFIAFAGEEMGLLGSRTYVNNPLFPLSKSIAMINLDMIGRNHPDSLLIIGAKQNPDLVKIIRKQNKKVRLSLRESKRDRMSEGSDHFPFYSKGIPAVFFFTGLHEDYHHVGDHADAIDFEKAARVSRLAFLTAWEVANSDKRPRIVAPSTRPD